MTSGKSEFALIDWIRQRSQAGAAEGVIVGIGDDMAVLNLGDQKVLVTTDMLLEGVHFDLAQASLAQVGYKAMACSLSDCAAMAAEPVAAVVAVALPRAMSMEQATQLHEGLNQAAQKYQCPLVGGDTTSWDKPLAIDVTMLARPGSVEPVLRSGARVGDAIMVTGRLGGSARRRHLTFEPRLDEARILTELAQLTAMIDLSDGLSSDLDHICRQSRVAAVIDAEAVPISSAAQETTDPLGAALSDGEDFELLFCVGSTDADELLDCWPRRSDVPLTRIGRIVEVNGEALGAQRLFLQYPNGKLDTIEASGWEHFCE